MMSALSLQQVADATSGALFGPDNTVSAVSTDTRTIAENSLFVALKGERFDGHEYLNSARDAGAIAAVVSHRSDANIAQVEVADTQMALGQIAALNRDEFVRRGGRVLALTGSCGKTSCKEMLSAILKQRFAVLATTGNLNNEIGVPLTLLELAPEHEVAVIEMGAAKPGDIAYLCQFAKPDIALITNAAPAHLAGFGSLDGVAKTKGEIYQALPASGVAIINLDDRYAPMWAASTSAQKVRTVSLENTEADFYASDIQQNSEGTTFTLHTPSQSIAVCLPLLGRAMVGNALLATAAATAAGAQPEDVVAGLGSLSAVPGRLFPQTLSWGVLIDDAYNANPASVRAAIDVLAAFPGRRVLILGDMAELGNDAVGLHEEVGRYAREKRIDVVLAVGVLSRHTAEAAGEIAVHFETKEKLIAELQGVFRDGDTILVKGSRSAGMETVVEAVANSQVTGGSLPC